MTELELICSYCGNKLEENESKAICPECGRAANTQQIVFTEEPSLVDMMPIFGLVD